MFVRLLHLLTNKYDSYCLVTQGLVTLLARTAPFSMSSRGANSTALAVDLPFLVDFRTIYRSTALELNSTAKLMFYG